MNNKKCHVNIKCDLDESLEIPQKNAILGCLNKKISILSGGPGTGKTSTVLRKICLELVEDNKRVLFLAPTHAAKNRGRDEIIPKDIYNKNMIKQMEENCKFETLQSAIFEYEYYDFISQQYIIDCKMNEYINSFNYLIIDETSMVKSEDLCNLLAFIHDTKISLLMVGDPDQLPAIGMGCPFYDLINSNYIANFRLIKNFRSQFSDIPKFLEVIKLDDYFAYKKEKYNNIHFKYNSNYKDNLKKLLTEFKNNGLVPYNGIDAANTFQILSPFNINVYDKELVSMVRRTFFNNSDTILYELNDIIIMKKNTPYFKNGDYAKIINKTYKNNYIDYDISLINNKFSYKKYDDENIEYLNENTIKITLYYDVKENSYFKPSFVMSVHTSQGLGFNNVITIYTNYGRPGFISKKLNYTAFSRAKENVYILGENTFYKNKDAIKRNTLINHLINKNVRLMKKKKIELSFNNIVDSDKIIEDCKNKRKKIPQKVRYDVFKKRNNNIDGKCYVCNKHIDICNFHVGHIISVFDGGANNIDNLEPICAGCNLSMGKENLHFYKEKYYSYN